MKTKKLKKLKLMIVKRGKKAYNHKHIKKSMNITRQAVGEDSVFKQVDKNVQRAGFMRALKNNLTEREYRILCLRYGLGGNPALPQREVAALLKISRSYISRIEKKAIEKLRKVISDKEFFVD